MSQAAYTMNASSQEGKYGEFGKHHKKMLKAMETEKFKERIHDFDRKMEPQRPMFKFAKEYMKFVASILMFLRATREGHWKLHLESLKALCKYFFTHDRLNYVRMAPLYLAQMELLESTHPDIHEELMSGNFCVNKNDIPFCAIGPDRAIEHVNKTTKIRFDPATAMARWFLIAPELSRLAVEAEAIVGLQTHSLTHNHDLLEAVITRYDETVKNLEDVFKANDPFVNEENELINIIAGNSKRSSSKA